MRSYLFAIGGNALTQPGESNDLAAQYDHARQSMAELADILRIRPAQLVITHGNGPQVGNVLYRSEYSREVVFPLTLDVCVSDTEGGMGYMLQQVLHNQMLLRNMKRNVVTLITQTEVDPHDPAMTNPSKYIGQWYTKEEASRLDEERGWTMRRDGNRGWRRVVASPRPVRIVETEIIRSLLRAGNIVIAGGGGGIPVVQDERGLLRGVEGVVDKDLASALLAARLGIDTLVIITAVEKVCLDFGSETPRALDRLNLEEAMEHLEAGQFPPGSMGPKIRAAMNFLLDGGGSVVLTCPGKVREALEGRAGTLITRH